MCISVIVGIVASVVKPKSRPQASPFINAGKSAMRNQIIERDGIGFIELDGTITSEKDYDIFGNAGSSVSEKLADAFEYYARNMNTKAIVISINSPGGSVVACDEAYTRMKRAIERNQKPVIVVFRDIAASGGYYLAMIADEIYASEGTITGSIGVILQSINFKGLMDKHGVRSYSFTTGEWKNALSPFGDVTPVEEAYFDELVLSMFGNFTNKVLDGRGDRLIGPHSELFDGRIFSGILASEFGLIDGIATVDQAITIAAERAGLNDIERPYLVPYLDESNTMGLGMLKKIVRNEFSIFNILFNGKTSKGALKNSVNIKSSIGIDEIKVKYQGVPMFLYPNALYAD